MYREKILPYDLNDRTLRPLSSLLVRPWFDRLWIWQEVYLAKPGCVVTCGHFALLWNDFCNAIGCIVMEGLTGDLNVLYEQTVLDRINRAYYLARMAIKKKAHHFPSLIMRTKTSNCTDSRDRVFALSNLMHPSEAKLIKPDYKKSPSKVYEETVFTIAKHKGSLELLRLCNLRTKLVGSPSLLSSH